jgi:hypothetical protein
LTASGHEEGVVEERRIEVEEEPEAQVLPERELMLLVAPDMAPQDLPAPEPDEAGDDEAD